MWYGGMGMMLASEHVQPKHARLKRNPTPDPIGNGAHIGQSALGAGVKSPTLTLRVGTPLHDAPGT